MNKTDKLFYGIALNIIVMFGIWFIWSFAGDYMEVSGVFGDVTHKEGRHGFNSSNIEWGSRHYIWFWCWVSISLVMIIKVVFNIIDKIENYDEE